MHLYNLPAPLPLLILQSIDDLQTLHAAICSCSLLRIVFQQQPSALFENAARQLPIRVLDELQRLSPLRALARYHYLVCACTTILEKKLDQLYSLHYEHQLERTNKRNKCGSRRDDPAGMAYRPKRLPLFWDEQQNMIARVLRGEDKIQDLKIGQYWAVPPWPRNEVAGDFERAWRHTQEEACIRWPGDSYPSLAFSRNDTPLYGADRDVLKDLTCWNHRRLAAMYLASKPQEVYAPGKRWMEWGVDEFFCLYEEWYNEHWFYHSVLKSNGVDGPCGENCTYHLGVPHICVHPPEEDYVEDELA